MLNYMVYQITLLLELGDADSALDRLWQKFENLCCLGFLLFEKSLFASLGVASIDFAVLRSTFAFGYIMLTTSAGIMDHEEARRKNVFLRSHQPCHLFLFSFGVSLED